MLFRDRSQTYRAVLARMISAIAPPPPPPSMRSLSLSSRAARRLCKSLSVTVKMRLSPSGQHETACFALIASRRESDSDKSSMNTPGSWERSGLSCMLRTRFAKPSTSPCAPSSFTGVQSAFQSSSSISTINVSHISVTTRRRRDHGGSSSLFSAELSFERLLVSFFLCVSQSSFSAPPTKSPTGSGFLKWNASLFEAKCFDGDLCAR
mmetsp:Transcript_17331/g.43563  ORF Transcript_17331/g.43563 Transcript_17331/m.43563 type:complete len:208 (+) Transcript_17331:1254-1877(+)